MDLAEKMLVIAIGLLIIAGIACVFIEVSPISAEWECAPYVNEGYNTKIVAHAPVGFGCWIEHDNQFIPLKKWLAVKGVGINGQS